MFSKTYDRESLDIQQLDFDYLNIKSKIELKETHKTTNVTAIIRIKKDSLIWFNLSGALGVQGMRGLVTQDSVFIINRVAKEYSIFNFSFISCLRLPSSIPMFLFQHLFSYKASGALFAPFG